MTHGTIVNHANPNQDVLAGAIQGRGAFRRFKDKLYDLSLEKQWYQYRDEAYEKSQGNGVKDIRLFLLNKRKANAVYEATLKYVPDKDRKAFATDLKTIYHAHTEEKARETLDNVAEKWTPKYPNAMKRWYDNWDVITPIFKFSPTVRKVIYTTNAIESLNSTYRRLNRQRSVFASDTTLLKALYLATFEATKKWTQTIRNWGAVYGKLCIMYDGRLPD